MATRNQFKKNSNAQVQNRNIGLAKVRATNQQKADADSTAANAAMLNAQQQMALTRQQGVNQLANTGLSNTGQMNQVIENNKATAQRQLAGFDQANKQTMQGQNWDKDKMRLDQDFARETMAANRGFQVEDQQTAQTHARDTAAYQLGGQVLQDTGDPRLASQVASGDFNNVEGYTPTARLAKPEANRYQYNAGKFNKDDRLSPDMVFDQKRGVSISTNAMNTYNRLQNMGSQEEANAFVSELKASNPDLYEEILGYISVQ